MLPPNAAAKNVKFNKIQVRSRMQFDGRLVAPIDLTLETAYTLKLDPLIWWNLNVPPKKMKISNTGETAVVSGKWGKRRPHLTGGPLVEDYLFSQIHFHWGGNEHEGSEHTVRGRAYPMEMHVVLYKANYLTQERALKHEDGVVILAYLVKQSNKSSSGIQGLANHLGSIVGPKSHSPLGPTPLTSILEPMIRDYLIYWGALVTKHCSHTILWLVSRSVLAIKVEDLDQFRKLQTFGSEPMTKNFRKATSPQGRIVFHVNPSTECEDLLLQDRTETLQNTIVANNSHTPENGPQKANSVHSSGVGDFNDNIVVKLSTERNTDKKCKTKKTLVENSFQSENPKIKLKKSSGGSVSTNSVSLKTAESRTSRSPPSKPRAIQRKTTEEQKTIVEENKNTPQHCKKSVDGEEKKNKIEEVVLPKEESADTCISKVTMSEDSSTVTKNTETPAKTKHNHSKTSNKASRLPVRKPTKCLESSLAQYFKTPEPSEKNSPKLANKLPTKKPRDVIKRPANNFIPKPIGINAGKMLTNKKVLL